MGAKLVSTTMRLSLILALQSFLINDCHGCLCKVVPNFSCPPPPHCCESGMYTYDECGCCLTCAKSELQPCGGPNGVGGKCAKGLSCLKTCSPCKTIGSEGEACVFPFIYEGIEYDGCTSTHAAEGAVWCATQVNQNGTVIEGKWGDCSEGCPGARNECNDRRFSIIEGQCVNPAVPGAIPNWIGAPSFQLLPPTADLFKAPICDRGEEGRKLRLYENTCRCAQGEDAVEIARDGSIRGNCSGVDTDREDGINPVWCFLENVRDPHHPKSGCFADTTWSARDGRFWSAEACHGLPVIADTGFKDLPDAPDHLLGRNHPLVLARKRAENPQISPEADPFSFYYTNDDDHQNDYQVDYNYNDDQDFGVAAPAPLPIINNREKNSFEFLPTPLPIIQKSVDPLPLTTMKTESTTKNAEPVTPTAAKTTTENAEKTTTENAEETTEAEEMTTVTEKTEKMAEAEKIVSTIEQVVTTIADLIADTTIMPASTSKWKEVDSLEDLKPTTVEPKVELTNEIIEETGKDGSKLVVVQALQRAAKKSGNFKKMEEQTPDASQMVDLGIFGSFWLQKSKAIDNEEEEEEKRTRPNPIFRREQYFS